MPEFIVITDCGNGFKTRKEAVEYAEKLQRDHPLVPRPVRVFKLVETVSTMPREVQS